MQGEKHYPLDSGRMPQHIAIIMDGNRRWAKQRGLPALAGHWKGAETLTQIVSIAADLKIKVLTVYAFSAENWTRSPDEIRDLMQLFQVYLLKQEQHMINEGIKLEVIGDIARLPEDLQAVLMRVKKATAHCRRIELVLALSYGGRDDIVRAASAIAEDYRAGTLSIENLSEEIFASYLDTAGWQDPDLLIRTSGESRLSNFLLWQISYAEVYISDILWPDFHECEFRKAMFAFQQRDRRFGGS